LSYLEKGLGGWEGLKVRNPPSENNFWVENMMDDTIRDSHFIELCNKLLDSTNASPHMALLFCTKCHGRKFGPKGVGFGLGGGVLTMDTGERFGNREVEMT
jgi:hypothetical protein